MVWVANGENRSETCEYALTPGSAPYRALTRLRASPRPPAGKNWPSLEAVRPVPQKAAIGSAAWASTTTANARSNASPSTCQRAMRINSQNPVRGRGLGHLAEAEVDSLGEQHVEQTDAVVAGLAGSQVREGLGEPGGVVHLEQDVGDPNLGHPPVEVGDQVSGPVRHGGFRPLDAQHAVFDAPVRDRTGPRCGGQPAQALVQGDPALGEPIVRTGRDRQAAVGISDGRSRQQRLSDVAVAARPRQPDVAGAERVAQVEQHCRLPQAVIELGAQQPGSTSNSVAGSRSAAPWRRCAGRRRLPAKAWPRATPRCPACAACAACSAGSGCSPPARDSTGPTRPCWRGRQPLRRGLRDLPIRGGSRLPRRAPRPYPAHPAAHSPGRRRTVAPRGPRPFRPRAALHRCARRCDTSCRRSCRGSPPRRRRGTSPTRRRRLRESRGDGASGSSRRPSAK